MWTCFLSEKSDTPSALEKVLSDTRTDGSIDILRTDGGTKFKGAFQAGFKRLSDKRELTSPNSPQFNGCTEKGSAVLE